MNTTKRARFACALSLISVCLSAGCQHEPTAKAEPPFKVTKTSVQIDKKGPVAFNVAEVKEGRSLPLPSVTARIVTVEALTSPSFAPLSGRVAEVKVHIGDHVEKGQQLVLVRTADLPTLERDVRSAELSVATQEANVERMRALVESRAGSQHDLVVAQAELAEARLAQKAAKARMQSLQITRGKDDSDYWIAANRSGTVVQLDATSGLQVGPDRGPVATVADLAEVLAVADVPQRDAAELERGAHAQVFPSGAAGAPINGVVEVVSEVVDPDRQTVPVRVRVDNDARKLRPNAFVDLTFEPTTTASMIVLPAASVVRDGSTAVVFIQGPSGVLVRRAVVLGKRTRDEVEIVSGVVKGERVVTSGALLLLNALDVEA